MDTTLERLNNTSSVKTKPLRGNLRLPFLKTSLQVKRVMIPAYWTINPGQLFRMK